MCFRFTVNTIVFTDCGTRFHAYMYVYEYLAVYMRLNGDETQHKVKVANFSHIFIDGTYMCHFGTREICFAAGSITMLLWGWYIYVVLTVATPNHQQLLAEEKKPYSNLCFRLTDYMTGLGSLAGARNDASHLFLRAEVAKGGQNAWVYKP